MENLIRIKEIIEEEQLKIRNQNPIKVSRRWFFYLWLRKNGFILREIGELFNVGHATVIHGIKQAEYFQTKKMTSIYYLRPIYIWNLWIKKFHLTSEI